MGLNIPLMYYQNNIYINIYYVIESCTEPSAKGTFSRGMEHNSSGLL